jgi:serine/threonine protein kinase
MLAQNQVLQHGRYRIINQLEQNGIGASYEAFDDVLGTNVLLKEIAVSLNKVTPLAQIETLKQAFAVEAEFLKKINHDSILRVHHYFSEIDRHYLVLEHANGEDLSELLEKSEKPFLYADVLNWADQLLDAFTYLHTFLPPVVHQDIKPQNVRLTKDGKIKLLAFGIAKHSDAKVNTTLRNQAFDTSNLHYLPLEQIWEGLDTASRKVISNSYDEKSQKILEQPADARTDIYALGALLYRLLTNKLPVDALERSIDVLEGKSDPLPSPEAINSSVPPEVSDVVMKALEIRREERFSSAVIMRQVLRTSFVRVKERRAAEAKRREEENKQQNSLDEQNRLEQERKRVEQEKLKIEAEQKRLEHEQKLVEQKRLEVEAEHNRQAELIKQKLQEAEAQRAKAEQRATEAERRLLEKEAKVSNESPAMTFEFDEDFLQIPEAEPTKEIDHEPDVIAYSAAETLPAQAASTEVFKDMFAEPQKENKLFKRMAAAVAILVVLGIAGLAVWNFALAKPAEANQSASAINNAASAEPTPAPTVEAAVLPQAGATNEATQTPAVSTETAQTSAVPAQKNKLPVAAATPIKKTVLPTAKPTPAQKKAVTVDDLINDN